MISYLMMEQAFLKLIGSVAEVKHALLSADNIMQELPPCNPVAGHGEQTTLEKPFTVLSKLLVGAVALIGHDGRVLLAERPEGKPQAGYWEFPGGKVC